MLHGKEAFMQVYALRSMNYVGQDLEKGQLFELQDALHDDKLLKLRYAIQFAGTGWQCGQCTAAFAAPLNFFSRKWDRPGG